MYTRPPPPFQLILLFPTYLVYYLPPCPCLPAAQRAPFSPLSHRHRAPHPLPTAPNKPKSQTPRLNLASQPTPRQAWVPRRTTSGSQRTARRAGGARAPASCRIRANMRYYVRRVPTLCTQLITRARSIPVSRSPEFLFSFEFSSFAFSFASAFGFLKVS